MSNYVQRLKQAIQDKNAVCEQLVKDLREVISVIDTQDPLQTKADLKSITVQLEENTTEVK